MDQDTTLLWPSLLRRRHVVNAQAFVAGREATSAVFCWEGAVLADLHFEVVHKMHAAGHAAVLRMIEHPEMSVAAEKMVRRLNLSGLYGFDFMLETHTENAYLIEINPRTTQVGHLALGAGRDLPAALYAALSGESVRETPKVTNKDTIALFPQEWMRDPASEFLRSSYHDVPWEAPALVSDCIRKSQTQRAWYRKQDLSAVRPPSIPLTARSERRAVELDCEAK
jgi:predicted ATP-grasp superfamily ATP-dependent carboligase